jgi:hypothetical protein
VHEIVSEHAIKPHADAVEPRAADGKLTAKVVVRADSG